MEPTLGPGGHQGHLGQIRLISAKLAKVAPPGPIRSNGEVSTRQEASVLTVLGRFRAPVNLQLLSCDWHGSEKLKSPAVLTMLPFAVRQRSLALELKEKGLRVPLCTAGEEPYQK